MYLTARQIDRLRRRGVVLILVLALLSLLALIGVTFATLSGQAQVGARNYAAGRANQINPETFFDFGLNQLVNDTNNPKSFMRGHSLLRDMYGHDARNNGYLPHMPEPLGWPLAIVNVAFTDNPNGTRTYRVETNIPTQSNALIQKVPSLYTAYFGPTLLYPGGPIVPGWTMRLQQWVIDPTMQDASIRNPGRPLTQFVIPETINPGENNDVAGTIGRTFEVVNDDATGGWHIFTLAPIPLAEVKEGRDNTASGAVDQRTPGLITPDVPTTGVVAVPRMNLIELDNRYVRAFNGTGMSQEGTANYIPPQMINFLYNNGGGFTDPNNFTVPAMDEDYDAPDHENVFLGLQSADGQVVIPSFHRPNQIVYDPANPNYSSNPPLYNDWENYPNGAPNAAQLNNIKRSKFLRPRRVDHPLSGNSFPDLIPDPATGKITYDVDNDGDGVTDAVWLDLGYPSQRNADGKLYKPLFAFTVIGLNGRLPLNTVGNLQQRAPENIDVNGDSIFEFYAGGRTFRHTSNLGYSPFEINPGFALTNSMAADVPLPDPPGVGRDGTWLLRRILTGNNDPNAGVTEGRYGEPEAFLAGQVPAAGRSYLPNSAAADLIDGNFNTTDFYPSYNTANGTHPELPLPPAMTGGVLIPQSANLLDMSTFLNTYRGRMMLPAERFRYFVNPIDIVGTGRVMEWDQLPSTSAAMLYHGVKFGLGYDNYGRVSFYQHFRPPGFPADLLIDTNADGLLTDEDITRAPLANRLHGFESHRNPATSTGGNPRDTIPWNNEFMGRAPFDVEHDDMAPGDRLFTNKRLTTFDNRINSSDVRILPSYVAGNPVIIRQGMYPGRDPVRDASYPANRDDVYRTTGGSSLGLNEDFQMNLYGEDPYDKPFDSHDTEWLYRRDDRDGTSLQSRLPALATVGNFRAFLDNDPANLTASARRKLFSDTVWELNRPAWSMNYFSPFNAPNLASVGRKINLNYPLPISNNSREPVRQKWCREAFDLLLQLYYPGWNFTTFPPTYTLAGPAPPAPRPEDIARLGQFVVNIIDFRDTDDTMTLFVNPYLKVYPSEMTGDLNQDGNPGTLPGDDLNNNGILDPARVTWIGDNTYNSAAEEYNFDGGLNLYQWGMEYLPVAINEVLAYQAIRKDTTKTGANKAQPSKRLFIELVNMLTENANGDTNARGGGAADLTLRGWGFIIVPDRPDYVPPPPGGTEDVARPQRPNTVTGQVAYDTISSYYVPLRGTAADPQPLQNPIEALDGQHGANNGGGAPDPLPNHSQADPLANRNYVMANDTPPPASGNDAEKNVPPRDAAIEPELIRRLPRLTTAQGEYFWLYLVRPANAHAGNMAAEPKVVVDSFRFSYTESGGTVIDPGGPTEDVNLGNVPLYSLGRSQPLRGGHAVPDSHRYTPPYAYGYTEQTSPDTTNGNLQAWYFKENTTTGNENKQLSQSIHHSMGDRNQQREDWDYFAFHDRDFANVAELLVVPETPPGLLTKKFAENTGRPDPVDQTDGFPGAYPDTVPPNAPPAVAPDLREPHTYPYLAQRFYYWNAANPNDRAGWHRILEFFEVPSPLAGAIGPVANGDNADWLRKDLRSGMLNLNLIIDEEVFYGLIDDPRLSTVPAYTSSTAAALPQNGVPQLITAISADGTPTFHYPMSDLSAHPYGRGFLIVTPPAFWPLDTVNGNPIPLSAMKAAFADFIKLRHGGSGYLGGVRNVQAPVAYPNAVGNLLPEKPFRSFTTFLPNGASPPNPFLSIYDTLMRPAKLGAVTGDVATMPAVEMDVRRNPGDPADLRWFNRTELPPRMLFQLPFYDDPANPNDDSPASEIPMTDRSASPATYAAANDHPFLSNRNANLFDSATDIDNTTDASLGWNGGGPGADRRRHPYWQTEILQKISNNTTVRTHQFAVWVTVGLFEVVLEGDSSKVLIDPNLAVDQLGKEIGRDAGTAVRYRAFFIVDRTRAFGFDPNNPDDFRPLVVYRKRIE